MQWCCGQPRPGVCVRSSRQMRHTRMLTPVRHPESGHAPMKPRITVITIGVDDLEVSLRFYRDGLGFATEGIIGKEFEYGAVVFIELQSGLRLALWPRKSLGHDAGLAVSAASATEMSLGHNVGSKDEEIGRAACRERGCQYG